MDKHINLIKLCVGADSVEDLLAWQAQRRADWADGHPRHITRMWPKRAGELLNGGSLYWVFRGLVLARQAVLGLEEVVGGDGTSRCALVLDPGVRRTEAVPRRPFQGWRYLPPADAPRDLTEARASESPLPPGLAAALAEIGVR